MTSILSEDLEEEILSRVPATSLKRLRSTCKQWNALFSDHQFIKKHVDKAPKEFKVVMSANSRVYSLSGNPMECQNSIDPSIEVKGELSLLGDENTEIFHCNGLLLCTKATMYWEGIPMVYNPCTGQTRWVELKTTVYAYSLKFALGYENNKPCFESYKILRFCRRERLFAVKFEIYEFKSNSWRVLDDIPHDHQTNFESKYRGVSLMGNTYWIALGGYEKMYAGILLQFDFTKERFQRFHLPFECNYHADTVKLSTVREEKLAVLFKKNDTSTVDVWLTNKIDQLSDVSWRVLFKVDLYGTYKYPSSMSFVVDEENKVALCCDKGIGGDAGCSFSSTYIIGEDILKQVDFLGKSAIQPIPSDPFLFSYVPSLIQIEEPKEK